MTLKKRISEDVKVAMRARDARRLGALRLLMAAIRQKEVDERIELNDEDIVAVINKMLKQRRDSIAQFAVAGRNDLVDNETFEIEVLRAYLPAALADNEVAEVITQAIAATCAVGPADMGKVMHRLRAVLAGPADMSEVSRLVKSRLAAV